MKQEWQSSLVILSLVIAVLGSYVALVHADRMTESKGRSVWVWMVLGGLTLGVSIWAMHFVGMLAFRLPIELMYDAELTLLSVLPSFLASVLGFHLLKTQQLNAVKLIVGGAVMGLGIVSMHYIGMAALMLSPALRYNPAVVMTSVVIAVVVAISALWIGRWNQRSGRNPNLIRLVSALIMGVAITGMHYVAMHDMHIDANSVCISTGLNLPNGVLAMAVASAVMVLLLSGLVAALFYKRIREQELVLMARAHTYLEMSPDSLLVVNANGSLHFVNQSAMAMFALPAEITVSELKLQTFIKPQEPLTKVHELASRKFFALPQTLSYLQPLIGYDIVATAFDGRTFTVEVSVSEIEFSDAYQLLIAVRDVTLRRVAETRLVEAELMLRGLSESLPVAIYQYLWLGPNHGKYNYISKKAQALFGVTPESILQSRDALLDSVYEADRPALIKAWELANETCQPWQCEVRHVLADGSIRWVLGAGVPVSTSNAMHLNRAGSQLWCGYWMDVTDRLQLVEALSSAKLQAEAASKAKSDFLANMSHEIRTPMNAIIGLSQLIRQTQLNVQQQKYLSRISQAGKHLLGIINDILDFSKVEAGKLTLEYVRLTLDRVLGNVSAVVGEKAAVKGLELIFDVAPDVPSDLMGDPLRLGQVLINFTNNAVKFTDRGEITVKVRKEADLPDGVMLHFTVKDSGIGLSEEQVSRLFNSFEQADMSTTRKFGGTGLGLVISKRLTELMGGQVGVSSVLGVGSEFWFTAKLGVHVAAHNEITIAHPDLRGLRVLVVDDNPSARAVLEGLLERMSFEVTSVDSGLNAIAEVKAAEERGCPYRVVFLDWQMPVMNGGETARQLAKLPLRQKPHCILLTGYGGEGVLREAQDCGFDEILVKPVNQSLLFDCLMSVLSQSKTHSPLQTQDVIFSAPYLRGLVGKRILLAEDNDINQEVAQGMLEASGLMVDVAANGLIAVELARQQTYDLILMDMQMPVMDGVTAAVEIRKLPSYESVPIVPMTANVMPEHRALCEQAGMVGFIPKPIDAEVLWTTLTRWLAFANTSSGLAAQTWSPAFAKVSLTSSQQLPEGLRYVRGFNVDAGLSRTMGNASLYVSLLKRFLPTVDDLMQKAQSSLDVGDLASAQLHVHTLKGVSANVGAQDLAQTAALLEQALSTHVMDAVVEQKLIDLLVAVANIHADFEKIPVADFDVLPPNSALKASPLLIQAFVPKAEMLMHLLRDDDPKAVKLAREYETLLTTFFGKEGQEILDLCEDMELEMAAIKLEQLMRAQVQKSHQGETKDV